MRKFELLFSVLLLCFMTAAGQTKVTTGKVTDEKGAPIEGASVVIKGLTTGVITDGQGSFRINAKPGTVLVISSTNFGAREVTAGNDPLTIVLNSQANVINEVVVTALGIRREKRELASATQTIGADQINKSGTGNPLGELNGKASGLTVINASGDPGAGTYIRLRGITSITGNNQPLIVVDGILLDNSTNNYDPTSATANVSGPASNLTGGVQPTNRGVDINPNDIESITLLKGPAATALYGIQAASGALIITTKKASGKKGTTLSFNSSFTIDKVSRLPKFQKLYSQGSDGQFANPDDGTGARRTTWGALIDTLYRNGIANDYDKNGDLVGQSDPTRKTKAGVYNPYDFFHNGYSYNNNLALSGGNNKTGYRMSLGNLHQLGIAPKSKYDKTSFSVNGQSAINDRFTISGGITYVRSTNDKVQQGSNTSGIMLGLLRTPTTFDNSNGLKNAADNPASYLLSDGLTQRDYRGGAGYDNPFWTVNRVPFHEDVDRLYGYGQASYQLLDWMTLGYRLGGDTYSQDDNNAYDIQSNAFPAGAINIAHYANSQFNSDFTINMKKSFSDKLLGTLLVGHNYFTLNTRSRITNGSGLVLPDFLDLSNATSYTASQGDAKKHTMAFYGEAHLDYFDRLFLTLSGRRETSSTLPAKNNSFFYPSAALAYEFTKSKAFEAGKVLSYGKLRFSYSQVGKDAPVQGLATYFGPGRINDGFTSGISYPINGIVGYQYSSIISVIGNPDLKAEKTRAYELGADLGFWKNRVTLNATAYYSKSSDVILTVPIAYSTGFASKLENAAVLTNKGLELTLNTTPVKSKDFRWDLNFNWSRNINRVKSLALGVDRVLIAGFTNGEVDAIAGKAFGQIYGTAYVRSDPNNPKSALLINDNPDDPGYGMPIVSTQSTALGDVNPAWTGSAINTLTYKGLSLGFQLDVRHGGDIWNGTRGAMSYFGTSEETANRGKPVTFGGVLGHLDESGNIVHNVAGGTSDKGPGASNNVATTYSQYYWQNVGSSFIGPAEPSVERTSFVRIRQISLTYDLPKSFIQRARFSNLSITIFANNPVLWTKYTGVDPETSLAGPVNGQGLDYFNNPGSKSYGIRLNLGL